MTRKFGTKTSSPFERKAILEDLKFRGQKQEALHQKNDSNNLAMNIAMGDMMGTGIPGGIDFNISTPL